MRLLLQSSAPVLSCLPIAALPSQIHAPRCSFCSDLRCVAMRCRLQKERRTSTLRAKRQRQSNSQATHSEGEAAQATQTVHSQILSRSDRCCAQNVRKNPPSPSNRAVSASRLSDSPSARALASHSLEQKVDSPEDDAQDSSGNWRSDWHAATRGTVAACHWARCVHACECAHSLTLRLMLALTLCSIH